MLGKLAEFFGGRKDYKIPSASMARIDAGRFDNRNVAKPANEDEDKDDLPGFSDSSEDAEDEGGEEEGDVIFTAGSERFEKRNSGQDTMFVDAESGLAFVSDGSGSQGDGKMAANVAANVFFNAFRNSRPSERTVAGVKKIMNEAFMEASRIIAQNDELIRQGKAKSMSDEPKPGPSNTTVTFAVSVGNRLVLGQIGDSRMYRQRNDKLELVSPEDSIGAIFFKYGLTTNFDSFNESVKLEDIESIIRDEKMLGRPVEDKNGRSVQRRVTKEDLALLKNLAQGLVQKGLDSYAMKDLRHMMTSGLGAGTREGQASISVLKVEDGDKFLICSDGLSDTMNDLAIKYFMQKYPADVAAKKMAATSYLAMYHSKDISAGKFQNLPKNLTDLIADDISKIDWKTLCERAKVDDFSSIGLEAQSLSLEIN